MLSPSSLLVLERQGQRDQQVQLDRRAFRVQQGPLDRRASKGQLEPLEPPEPHPQLLGQLAPLGPPERQVQMAPTDHREFRVLLGLPVRLGRRQRLQARRVQLAPLVLRVQLVRLQR